MRETRAVLVTGASAGIGHCVVRTLAERGHIVYGTIRKDSDVEKLKGIPGVIPLRVDVTIPEQIHEAVETVKNRGHGLFGLVNNAGIGELGMLNTWDNEDLRRIFDVNVFGPHRMTNAFLSFLLESRGRIVNIGSRGGMMSKPYFGPYTMTKHALESYTETLRLELERYGVKASIVQPGGVATSIGDASLPGTVARCRKAKPPFVEECQSLADALLNPPSRDDEAEESETNRRLSPPEAVADAVLHALVSDEPKLRYLVGTEWEVGKTLDALVDKLLDENDTPTLCLNQEQLIARLVDRLSARSTS